MARIPFLNRDEAPADVAAIYDRQEQATGRVLTTTQLRGHCAALLRGITAWGRGVVCLTSLRFCFAANVVTAGEAREPPSRAYVDSRS